MKVAFLSSAAIFIVVLSCTNPLPPFIPVRYPVSPWMGDSLESSQTQDKIPSNDILPVPLQSLVPDSTAYQLSADDPEELRTQVLFQVDTLGQSREMSIIKSSGNPSFDQAVLEQIMNTRYKPAMKDQQPISVWITLVISAEKHF